MKFIIYSTLFMLLSASEPLYADTTDNLHAEYYESIGNADKAIHDADWITAEKYLLEALRREPGNPSNVLLMSNLGMVRFNAGKDSLALVTLNDARLMAPASVTILQNRAHVLTEMGRINEAYNDYSTILQLDSTVIEPRFYHAMLALEKSDIQTAEHDISVMNRIAPDNRYTLLSSATLYRMSGQYDKAIPYLTRMINDDPSADHYSARALCYLLTGNLGDAAEDIANGIRLAPADGELYLYRAMLNKMRYRNDDAMADANRAISLGISAERVNAIIN